jgi:1-acyl-sn-glycerol-3-phosphate acyltransferase
VRFAVDICGVFMLLKLSNIDISVLSVTFRKNKFGFLKVEVVKSMKESMHFFGFALLVIFVDRNSLNKSHMFEDTKGVIKVRIWKKNKNTKMIYKTLHRKHKIEE